MFFSVTPLASAVPPARTSTIAASMRTSTVCRSSWGGATHRSGGRLTNGIVRMHRRFDALTLGVTGPSLAQTPHVDRGVIATANELFEARHYPGVVAMCSDALDAEPECVP